MEPARRKLGVFHSPVVKHGRGPGSPRGPWRFSRNWGFGVLVAIFLLGGCAVAPPPAVDTMAAQALFDARSVQLEALVPWRLSGRLALEIPGEHWAGTLHWRYEPARQILDWSGPMGRGGGRLLLEPGSSLLVTREGERHQAPDPESLMLQLTGQVVPVTGLQYWVRGLNRPDGSYRHRLDAAGQLMRLEQDGWIIQFGPFIEVGSVALPQRLELQRDSLVLRLDVQQWQMGVNQNLPAPAADAVGLNAGARGSFSEGF